MYIGIIKFFGMKESLDCLIFRQHWQKKLIIMNFFFKKIFSLIFVCLFYVSQADAGHCIAALTPSEGVLKDSPTGQRVYEALTGIINEDRHNTLSLFLSAKNDSSITLGKALNKIKSGRQSIQNNIRSLIESLEDDSVYHRILATTLSKMDQNPDCGACRPSDYRIPLAELLQAETVHDSDLISYLFEEWGLNTSFVEEALTAFEVPGFWGGDILISSIMPNRHLDRIRQLLTQERLQYILGLEIDAVTKNEDGSFTWYEVKSPLFTIKSSNGVKVDAIIKKQKNFQAFIMFAKENEELSSLINVDINLVFVIRGAGISDDALEGLRSQGINIIRGPIESSS